MSSGESYLSLFHQFVLRAVETVHAYLHDDSALPADEREQAWHVLGYGLKLPAAWPTARTLLLSLAPQMEREGFRHEWLPLLESGVESSQREDDRATEAQLSLFIGRIYRLRGALEEAQKWFQVSLERYELLDDRRGKATALNQLAYVANLQGRLADAQSAIELALSLLSPADPERAMSFFVLGRVVQQQGDLASAEKHQRASMQIWRDVGNLQRSAWSLQNLGDTLRVARRYDEAALYIKEAIVLLGQLNDPGNQAIARMNLGIVASIQGKSDEAMALHQLAATVFRQLNDTLHLAMVYNNMACEARLMKQWPLAEQHSLSSIRLWESLEATQSLASPLIELGLAYLGQARYAEAATAFERGLIVLPPTATDADAVELRTMLNNHLAEAREMGRLD